MCQSSARGRRRLHRPSLVRLIAPTRHLPLPPAPPIQSPSRGEERASGERREASAPSYFTTRRRRERGRSSAVRAAPAGGGGRAAPRLGPAELWSTGGRGGRDRGPRGRSLSGPCGRRRLLTIPAPTVSSGVPGQGAAAGNVRAPMKKRQQKTPPAAARPCRAFVSYAGLPHSQAAPSPRLRSRSRSRSDHRAPRPARAPPSGLPPHRRCLASTAAAGGRSGPASGN